jgi:CRP/FNR family cyclic AMP-dependent transcriptional regulator
MKSKPQATFEGQIYLREVELFQDLSLDELKMMEKMMPVKKVEAGNVFYCPTQPAEVLFLVKKGRVSLYHLSAEGTAFTTATVEAGTFFGEMALVGQSLYGSYAEAVTPCLLCIMSRKDVKMALLNDLRISSRLVETLGRRLIETEQRLADFALKSVAARVAALLLQLAQSQLVREQRTDVPVVGSVEVTCTHEELAQGVGAYRETVTKILNEWRSEKILELHRGRIVLLNLKTLHKLSAG